ncbi:hypothetical protein GWI33_005560 [Rhynchophorus ferrugineus]|uniref:Uncharacterized protein n=1 Tax=Rhynchophorus ferrugineus TaxID=354439 RepID=A0A834IMP5_RHYFE|nr:hypothetical protein GWI33_005560 [Rhynchophorus ferrugineus]
MRRHRRDPWHPVTARHPLQRVGLVVGGETRGVREQTRPEQKSVSVNGRKSQWAASANCFRPRGDRRLAFLTVEFMAWVGDAVGSGMGSVFLSLRYPRRLSIGNGFVVVLSIEEKTCFGQYSCSEGTMKIP